MLSFSSGDEVLSAYTSPLLVDLLDAAIRQVSAMHLSCINTECSLWSHSWMDLIALTHLLKK